MIDTNDLVDVLKRQLKQQGITYAVLATKLELSEASVKRMFATKNMSIKRLEVLCRVINLSLSDLLKGLEASTQRITHLTKTQEQELVRNPKILLVLSCVRNSLTFAQILNAYQIPEPELIQLLARLDRLKFIELLPNNRIKLTIEPDFRWLEGGPVENYYAKRVEKEYLQSRFNKENEVRLFLTGMVSDESIVLLKSKINQLAQEFAQLHRRDTTLVDQHNTNVGVVLAMRPWELEIFSELKK